MAFRRIEHRFGDFLFVNGYGPGSHARTSTSTTAPNSIDMAFLGHKRSLVRRANGRVEARQIAVGQGGTHGLEPIEFIDVPTPSDYVEIRLYDQLLQEVSDEVIGDTIRELPEYFGMSDPVLWSVMARLRAHSRGGWTIDATLAEPMVLGLAQHIATAYLGRSPKRVTSLKLDKLRLRRIGDRVEASLSGDLTTAQLADAASLSRFHFIRAFKATTGLTPHQYVQSRRMERARQLIQFEGWSITAAAKAVGRTNSQQFRRTFQRFFGVPPSALRPN